MEACTMFYYERERYMPSAVGLKYVGAAYIVCLDIHAALRKPGETEDS